MRERTIDTAVHTQYRSLSEFQSVSDHPPGILTVMHRGVPIDVWNDRRGFDTTTVFFHATLDKSRSRFPAFTGERISETLPTNRIFVSDPSLYLDDELWLAWYAGNHRQPKLQSAITSILRALIPRNESVVTFGSSGGGFAALYYASRLPQSTAVPVNPQTNLASYLPSAVERYGRLAWRVGSGGGTDVLSAIPATTDLVKRFRRPNPCKVFYVQNKNDRSHVTRQFDPFMKALPNSHYVYPLVLEGEGGHVPPPKRQVRAILASAIDGRSTPPTTASLARLC